MQVSILIVNYNTSELLINCIKSIYKQTSFIEFEIIVVDNHSSDDSVSKVRKDFPNVKVIENNQNIGFAKANNQAINESTGEVILLLNSDTIVLDGAIEKSFRFFKDHPDAGVVGCKLMNPDRSLQPSCRSFPSLLNYLSESFFLYKLFPKSQIFGRPFMTFLDYKNIVKVDVVTGAFMMIKRDVLDHVGLLDDGFFMYSEETDFCYRVRKNGWQIYYYPGAQIIHIRGGTSEQLAAQMFLELHKSQIRFCFKHHPGWYAHIEKVMIFTGVLLRYLHSQILCLWTKEERHIDRKKKYLKTVLWYVTSGRRNTF